MLSPQHCLASLALRSLQTMDAKRFENFTAELFAKAGDAVSVVEPVYEVIGDLVAEDTD